MKKLRLTIILLIILSSLCSAVTVVRISSLGHENYGIELCKHDSSCVYYQANTLLELSALDDVTIKLVDKQEDKFSLNYYVGLNYEVIILNIALIIMALFLMYQTIKIVGKK
jgi:hypothetical protein